jgi:hypothetical protein
VLSKGRGYGVRARVCVVSETGKSRRGSTLSRPSRSRSSMKAEGRDIGGVDLLPIDTVVGLSPLRPCAMKNESPCLVAARRAEEEISCRCARGHGRGVGASQPRWSTTATWRRAGRSRPASGPPPTSVSGGKRLVYTECPLRKCIIRTLGLLRLHFRAAPFVLFIALRAFMTYATGYALMMRICLFKRLTLYESLYCVDG